MKQAPIIIANWKMQFSNHQALQFCIDHKDELIALAADHNASIVLCPSYDALLGAAHCFTQTPILLGAQNCSGHKLGAYTGEVAVQSLLDLGIDACIVGHSERRTLAHETITDTVAKVDLLMAYGISPIICVGEGAAEHEQRHTKNVLQAQLDPLLVAINNYPTSKTPILIAYEPAWAIGTGLTPDQKHLSDIFTWLHARCNSELARPFTLIYGGSVNEKTASTIRVIPYIGGFLIGSASLDFKKFKNIVSLVCQS